MKTPMVMLEMDFLNDNQKYSITKTKIDQTEGVLQ